MKFLDRLFGRASKTPAPEPEPLRRWRNEPDSARDAGVAASPPATSSPDAGAPVGAPLEVEPPAADKRWKAAAQAFFAVRAKAVGADAAKLENLCYVSGRDPRLWSQPDIFEDMIASIVAAMDASADSRVLEVGCASGFLARGVAPRVGAYVGVDVAQPALDAAEQLGLANAAFLKGDGAALPFEDGAFDGAFCYDVFTNLPSIDDGIPIIREMLRVVRPGGKVLIGSIPDGAVERGYIDRVAQVGQELEERFGPPWPGPEPAEGSTHGAGRWPGDRPAHRRLLFLAGRFRGFGIGPGRSMRDPRNPRTEPICRLQIQRRLCRLNEDRRLRFRAIGRLERLLRRF